MGTDFYRQLQFVMGHLNEFWIERKAHYARIWDLDDWNFSVGYQAFLVHAESGYIRKDKSSVLLRIEVRAANHHLLRQL